MTDKAKHTPGPWSLEDHSIVGGTPLRRIADIDIETDEDMANADVILSTPGLVQLWGLIMFRLERERDLAKSRLEREKYDLLNSIVVDAQIAQWCIKEGLSSSEVEKALLKETAQCDV